MKGRIVLLLSLLCVAQALPLVYGDGEASDLTRNKRSKDGHTTLADHEVRTIISAIVDAILDGDKKKRSNIQEEEDEENDVNNTAETEDNESANNIVKNLNRTVTDDNEDGKSFSGSGNTEQDESESTMKKSESSGSSGDASSGSGEYSSGSGSNAVDIEDDHSVENNELKEQESPPFFVNPTFSNTERIKRDEEGQETYRPTVNILKRDIEESSSERPTSDSVQYKNYVEKTNESDESGSGDSISESSTVTSGSGSADDTSTSNTDEINKRDAIPDEENEESSSNLTEPKGINEKANIIAVIYKNETEYARNMTSAGLINATNNEENDQEDEASGIQEDGSTNDPQSSVSSEEASTSIDEGATSTAIEVEASGEDIDGSGSGIQPPILTLTNVTNHLNNIDIKPKKIKSQSNKTTESIKNVSPKVNETEAADTSQEEEKETDKEEDGADDDEVETSGIEISGDKEIIGKKSKIIEQIVLDMAKAAVESVESSKHFSSNEEDENGETKGSVVKKSSVPFEVISSEENLRNNMNPALIIITGDNDNDDNAEEIDRRSTIPKDGANVESNGKNKELSDDDDLVTVQEISPYIQPGKAVKTSNNKVKDIYKRYFAPKSFGLDDTSNDDDLNVAETVDSKKESQPLNEEKRSTMQVRHDNREHKNKDDTKRTSVPVYQGTVNKNELPSLQDKQYTKDNKALRSLVKSILNDDPTIKARIEEITNGKVEKEEKLEHDLIDLINKNSKKSSTTNGEDEEDDETTEKVVTEVKDFEGMAQALTREKSLSPWKHDMIVKKLEHDLLNHLSIPDDGEKSMSEQADELTEYSEMDFIKDKVLEAEAETSAYAQKHSHNLKAIRKHAITALRPIIEALPLKKTDVENLVHSISKSAWLKMVTHTKKNKHIAKKLRRSLRDLSH